MKMQGDLSRHHQPLNESFSARVTPELWEKYRLSDEQVAFFNENGYLSNIRILSDEQVAQLNLRRGCQPTVGKQGGAFLA